MSLKKKSAPHPWPVPSACPGQPPTSSWLRNGSPPAHAPQKPTSCHSSRWHEFTRPPPLPPASSLHRLAALCRPRPCSSEVVRGHLLLLEALLCCLFPTTLPHQLCVLPFNADTTRGQYRPQVTRDSPPALHTCQLQGGCPGCPPSTNYKCRSLTSSPDKVLERHRTREGALLATAVYYRGRGAAQRRRHKAQGPTALNAEASSLWGQQVPPTQRLPKPPCPRP